VRRVGRTFARHPWVSGIVAGVAAIAGVGGWYVWDQVNVPEVAVLYVVPAAPQLTAGPDETVYRVHPTRSSVTYEVEESVAGVDGTATGSTQGIAGDVALNGADASRSRFGEVVVDVAQLTSDESLRDRRLRHDFLESGEYPLARFVPTVVDGLPAGGVTDGEVYDVTIDGELTVKETTAPVQLAGTAERSDGELRLVADITTKMSTFDIGPIELLGFVQTADDVTLRFDITYVDPTSVEVPATTRAVTAELAATGDGPSFGDEVLPILSENCAGCHQPGGVGSMVWELVDAGDAAEVASGLALVVRSGFMPPWPASDLSAEFAHDRSLTGDEIDTVVAWAAAGGQLDVDPTTPVPVPPPAISDIRADLALTAAEPYQGSPAIRDDYRCFVLDPGVDATSWVAGWEFLADQAEIVHHAIGSKVSAAQADGVLARDAADPGPGWSCGDLAMGGGMQFLAWAPGQVPMRYRDGTGLRLEPGDLIVLQVHYHFAHPDPPADLSTLHLELLPAGDEPLEVTQRILLAPAEIPCRAGIEEGPLCDRTAAIADIATRFGVGPSFIPDSLVGRCGASLAELAAVTDGRASASCDHPIRFEADAISVFGHMHEIGDTFRMTLNPDTPDERVLLDIPVWDFGWQIDYQFVEPVQLRRGDVVRVECSWDRAHLRVPDPRYITWAEGTVDEMCYSGLTTVPASSRR
jgi:polyisoprenoid-binding protein YceI